MWQHFQHNLLFHSHPHNIMKEIKARAGYYLADPNKEYFFKAVKGERVDEANFIEVPEAEVEEIRKQRDAEQLAVSQNTF